MKSLLGGRAFFVAAILLGAAGCAHQQPLISHAHVGHCLSQWHDTPGNRGLLMVAEEELARARHETDAALAPGVSRASKVEHLRNATRALNPDAWPKAERTDTERQKQEPDYGAIRALESAVEHLEYAATSEDASPNIVASVATLSEMGVAIGDLLRGAATQARAGAAQDAVGLDRTAVELRALLRIAAAGHDADGDGVIEPIAAEAGLHQLHSELDGMLARESHPPYEPLPRKYLLGLVKLPNGKWAFLPWNQQSRPSYGY